MVSLNLTPQALRAVVDKVAESAGSSAFGSARNRTADASSLFIRGHKDSSINWQLLDDEAVERSREEDKLIFMHIGYKVCHHCRLMELESFSNPDVISILNNSFIPVLVDREERPDIDTTYMNYVQAVSNAGGWPLNLFLTSSLKPVFGGTYWPGPGSSRQSSSDAPDEVLDFLVILIKMRDTWQDQKARCKQEAEEVLSQLKEFAAEGTLGTKAISGPQMISAYTSQSAPAPTPAVDTEPKSSSISSELDLDQLEEAYRNIAGTFDPVCGGFGLAPKFPTPPKLEFLLKLPKFPNVVLDVVGEAECRHAQSMALQTLRKIRDGALRDHVGGNGFFRCSVTPDWSIPNFEKLVVDNALLLSLYLEAWKVSGGKVDSEFFDIVTELSDYLTSQPIALPQGGFASSEAADSLARRGDPEVNEGAYYLWTRREFDSSTGATNNHISQVVAAYWDVHEDGNVDQDHDPSDSFMNQNILRAVRSPEELSTQFSIPAETVISYIQTARTELKARREKDRVRPEIDDKLIAGWNGLVVSALARTAAELKNLKPEASGRCLNAANSAITFIKENLWNASKQELHRTRGTGQATSGFADDYAYLVHGLLDLFEVSKDKAHVAFAQELTTSQISLFYDPSGGFFTTSPAHQHTILRLKDGMDTSLPSINAVSASNLFRLHALEKEDHVKAAEIEDYEGKAKETINAFEAEMLQHPWLFPGLLGGVVTARLGIQGRKT